MKTKKHWSKSNVFSVHCAESTAHERKCSIFCIGNLYLINDWYYGTFYMHRTLIIADKHIKWIWIYLIFWVKLAEYSKQAFSFSLIFLIYRRVSFSYRHHQLPLPQRNKIQFNVWKQIFVHFKFVLTLQICRFCWIFSFFFLFSKFMCTL